MADPHDAAWATLRRYALEEEGFACVLADAMGRSNAMGAEVRPMWTGARLVGRAVTARPAGTELAAVFDAIDLAEPGDVVVVGGMVVRPGDAVLGDENGVVVVPIERLVAVMAAVPEALAQDRAVQAALAAGGTVGAYRRARGG